MCGRGHDRGPARTRRGVRKRVRIDVRAAIAQLRRQAAAAGGRGIIRGRQGDETRITTECVAIDGRGFDDARGTVDAREASRRSGEDARIRRFRVRRAPPRLFRCARRRARRLRRLRRRVCRFHRRRYRAVLVSHSFVVFIMTIRVARVLRVASSAQPTPTVFSNDVASARHTSSRVRDRAPRPRTRREHGLVGTSQGRPRPRLDRAGRLRRRERMVSVHPQDRPGEPIWRSARARRGVRATSDAGSDQERYRGCFRARAKVVGRGTARRWGTGIRRG